MLWNGAFYLIVIIIWISFWNFQDKYGSITKSYRNRNGKEAHMWLILIGNQPEWLKNIRLSPNNWLNFLKKWERSDVLVWLLMNWWCDCVWCFFSFAQQRDYKSNSMALLINCWRSILQNVWIFAIYLKRNKYNRTEKKIGLIHKLSTM